MLKLLFVLPNRNNQKVLAKQVGNEFRLPAYDELVGENVGFDEPQTHNDFFRERTGIPVFRRYSFNTQSYAVFIMEQTSADALPANEYDWTAFDEYISSQESGELRDIARSVSLYYNTSANMPWVNASGFSAYLAWLYRVCEEKGIQIIDEITQVKNAYVSTVFCVPTDAGNLYMKIPGKVFITELPFTRELKKMEMANLPVWVAHDCGMNVILMEDMGGCNLPSQSSIEVFTDVLLALSEVQMASTKHLPLQCSYNHSLDAILENLSAFSQKAFEILQGTQHEITQSDLTKLARNIASATAMLKPIMNLPIPDTIQHGDVRPGNIRVVDGNYMFYDWAWGAVSHPFIEASQFLNIIKKNLPSGIPAQEILLDAYLREWLAYGSYEELKSAFAVLDDLKELFMAYVDCLWLETIVSMCGEGIEAMSADGWLLERRMYYFAKVLHIFLEKEIPARKEIRS